MNLLNYQFTPPAFPSSSPTLVFIHGLFGDMNNLGVIARAFSENYPILRVDLRNHGESFHTPDMNYSLMADDLYRLIQHLKLNKLILIGHSMGGKTAMTFAARYPELVEKLIVIDIAPVSYQEKWHTRVFEGLFAVKQAAPETRQQARPILAQHIQEESIIQFMLKSFDNQTTEKFRFNVTALFQNYNTLMDWQSVSPCLVPTLFIKGGDSPYILPEYRTTILAQFPHSTAFTISGSGHWVHAEKPTHVVRAIEKFLEK
ncbi:alpha/beta fold hydrolase [Conservatibacter flavescens]|uniref:Alpha/beta hydrolase n=1 Tax=Conservatibacter flavescens TaxID=28161 RepID=A0A2M8S3V8_9PAST|nr:alpha/beta fold hydrolase [Conservatibacter flavescens]PJG85839.1 alpha/beta hydrolase [Conservatibacter flavescens]